MKRIIRLTESDLTRIVKRVLNEQNETIKVKAFYKSENSGMRRSLNLDTTNHKVVGTNVVFDYSVPGGSTAETITLSNTSGNYGCSAKVSNGQGQVSCGDLDRLIILGNVKKVGCKESSTGNDFFYLTPEGYKRLSSKCNAYASTDTKQDYLDMGGDYT
jgi:hypothetical protein